MITRLLENLRNHCAWLRLAGLFAIVLAAKLALIGHFGSPVPFWDQWDGEARALFIPVQEGRLHTASLFDAHCEHRIVCTRVLVLGLLKLNTLWDPKLEMVAQAFLHSGCIVLLLGLCGRQLSGTRARLLFTGFAMLVFLIPFGWENTLWGFQSQFYFVMLWGLLGLFGCWRHATLSAGWWLGILFFGLGLLSMAGGLLAPAVACGLMVLRCLQDRHDWRRQLAGILVLTLVVGAGFLLVKHIPAHDVLKAKSLHHFTKTLFLISSWPVKIATLAPLFQAPLLLLIAWALLTRRPATGAAWFLISLGLWGFAQSMAIAYGRAEGHNASRYSDNFTVTLVVGFACLLHLHGSLTGRLRRYLLLFGGIWLIVVMGGFIAAVPKHVAARIQSRYAESLVQEDHVRAFLASGDIADLPEQPVMQIPYPQANTLATALNNPALRDILPTGIRPEFQPDQITSAPGGGGFHLNGVSPATPAPGHATAWGSFDPHGSPAPVGAIELHFTADSKTSWLTFDVTGAPPSSGLSITLIDQKGIAHPVALPAHSGTSWNTLIVRRPPGPFILRMADESQTASLAFTLPHEIGFASIVSDFLQARAAAIALFGLALLGLGSWLQYNYGRLRPSAACAPSQS
jgi:hypothetical protein